MVLITIIQPAAEPVTVAEVKDSARIDGTALDAQIALLIPAFRMQAEHKQGRRLITQTVELVLDAFPTDGDIDLLLPCVQSIVSVKYLDSDGVQQTFDPSGYYLDSENTPCWLLVDTDWPTTGDYANAVRVRYTVGYGATSADVPADVKTWIIAQVCCALDSTEPPTWLDCLLDAGTVYRIA